jgi:hypothetical protein
LTIQLLKNLIAPSGLIFISSNFYLKGKYHAEDSEGVDYVCSKCFDRGDRREKGPADQPVRRALIQTHQFITNLKRKGQA